MWRLFLSSWTTCEKKTHFCIRETIEHTSHIGRIEQIKFEEDGPLFVESRRWKKIWWEGNAACCSANLSDYDLVSIKALKQAWLASFK